MVCLEKKMTDVRIREDDWLGSINYSCVMQGIIYRSADAKNTSEGGTDKRVHCKMQIALYTDSGGNNFVFCFAVALPKRLIFHEFCVFFC